MNVLLIGDNAITHYPTNMDIQKLYDALKWYCEKNNHRLGVISRDNSLPELLDVKVQKNKYIDIGVRLLGHSSFLYKTWNDNLPIIRAFKPDLIVLDRSRFGFIAKSARKEFPQCKIICDVDNVEVDFAKAYFADATGLIGTLKTWLELAVVKRDEQDVVKYSDKLFFLTKRNEKRYRELFQYNRQNSTILPICSNARIELSKTSENRNVLFVGTLSYAANAQAVEILLNIWRKHYQNHPNVVLTVAGRDPSEKLIALARSLSNVNLITNFRTLEDFVCKKSMMVLPIYSGSGMKTKVLEALSMGLMVAGTDEALVGYEEAMEADQQGSIIRANSEEEIKQAIDVYLAKDEAALEMIEKENKKLYDQYYTYERSRKTMETLCDEMLAAGAAAE